MSDIREFPMQPPDETPEVIEIRPLEVWPFLEAQWARDRERLRQEAEVKARELAAIEDFLRGSHVNQ